VLAVLRPVDFDYQPRRWTVEVHDVGANRGLLPEFVTGQSTASKSKPKEPLDTCRVAPKAASQGGLSFRHLSIISAALFLWLARL
jgi:hypothetical protein